MSQSGVINNGGGGTNAEQFVTDSGTAVPILNVIDILGGLNINTSGSGNTVTINLNTGVISKVTSPGAYPYTTLSTDYVIAVDTSLARTINLISSPATGRAYRIKDVTGSGAANNITITPAAGTIDGAASFIMNTNYASADFVYTGTSWSVL